MSMALKIMKLTTTKKSKNYSGGGREFKYVTKWNCEVFHAASVVIM
jgi:hypothetical protein